MSRNGLSIDDELSSQEAPCTCTELARQLPIVHYTTIHQRHDGRIFAKESRTLAQEWPDRVVLVVADGDGNTKKDGVHVIDLGSLPRLRLGRALVGSWRVFNITRRLSPAVCHFHDPELIPIFLLLRLVGYTVVFDVHEDLPTQLLTKHWIPTVARPLLARATRIILRAIEKRFSALVVCTPTIEASFPGGNTHLIRNFPMLSEFNLEPSEYATRGASFAYIGGLYEERGLFEMIRAVSEVSTDRPSTRLILAGVILPNSIVESAHVEPGWQHVDFHGYIFSRTDVLKLLDTARGGLVILHPKKSYRDAYPVKLFEYMAAGIPVIASDFPLWRTIVERADCGLLVDPLDTHAVAKAMNWILDNPREAELMGKRGREAVLCSYNWETEASTLKALYYELLSND